MLSSRFLFMIIGMLFLLLLMIKCRQHEDQKSGQIISQKGSNEEQSVETIKPAPINYDSLFIVLRSLMEAAKNNLQDIPLRKKLVAASYDTTWDTIVAVGFGKPAEHAAMESIAMKYAEQAAIADAYRWAAYIKKWHINPATPPLGAITTEIQGGRVVAKEVLPDHSVLVMVEIQSSKIQ